MKQEKKFPIKSLLFNTHRKTEAAFPYCKGPQPLFYLASL